MTLKAVLLDIDGTLLNSNDAHTNAWREALLQRGLDIPFERLRPYIGKGGDRLLSDIAGIDDQSEAGERIGKARRTVFTERYLLQLEPTRGARSLLLRFITDGLRLVVATSASGDELEALLEQAGVRNLIDAAASATDAEASKPDPDIVKAALRKAGLQPNEAVMLGDTPFDIEAANAAGVRCIGLRCGGWWTDAAFAGAIALYDDPMDLLQRLNCTSLDEIVEAGISLAESPPSTPQDHI